VDTHPIRQPADGTKRLLPDSGALQGVYKERQKRIATASLLIKSNKRMKERK